MAGKSTMRSEPESMPRPSGQGNSARKHAAEKCIAGAEDNGFGAEPIQLSIAAGLGIRYKLNDRIALFAEPTVSHHFDTDSQTKTLRTERPTNLNLLCGVRMTY